MINGLYIAAMEPNSGKSLVVLGVVELLSRRVQKLGFFRPIVRGDPKTDSHIQLIDGRYTLGSFAFPPGVGYPYPRDVVIDKMVSCARFATRLMYRRWTH